jgi:hypothetical protein
MQFDNVPVQFVAYCEAIVKTVTASEPLILSGFLLVIIQHSCENDGIIIQLYCPSTAQSRQAGRGRAPPFFFMDRQRR